MIKNIFFLIVIISFFSCADKKDAKEISNLQEIPDASTVPVNIASGNGSKLFIANCQTCHTPRYIEMQPKLSRKAWEKTVDKMIHAYGAPIDSISSIAIVDYLVRQQD
jgi:cytochrome c5